MVQPIPAEEVETLVGRQRDDTLHFMRADTKAQQTYILHSVACLNVMGLPDPACEFIAAQEKGIDEVFSDWEYCQDQPVQIHIDDDGYIVPTYVEVPEEHRFKPGARVKIRRDAIDTGDGHRGGEYVIEGYVDAEHRDVPLPYYMANEADGDMYGGCIPHAALEQMASPEEHAEQTKMPEPKDLMKAIASSLHSLSGEEIEIYETSLLKKASKKNEWPEGKHPFKNGIEFVGRTEGGRRFAGTLRLTSLYDAD
jgi:hypothetical protein